jgi:N,N'-diacetylchitobiose transport system permease protein
MDVVKSSPVTVLDTAEARRDAPSARPPGRRRSRFTKKKATPYLLATPAILLLFGLLAYPLFRMTVLSFQNMRLRHLIRGETPPWAGLDNYKRIFSDPFFWTVVRNTVVFTVVAVGLSVLLGLLVALLMRRVSAWIRIGMIIAMMLVWAMPQLIQAQIFLWMVDADFGILNYMIDQIPGVNFTNHSWWISSVQGWSVITTLVVWGAIPFLAVTLFAGLSQVPRDLVEAATVDGANAWQVFRNVTLPILRPLIIIVTTLSVIWDFQVFTQIWVLRDSKPERDYLTLSVYAYTESFGRSNYSLGSAIALITVLLMLGVMAFYIRQMFKMGDVE